MPLSENEQRLLEQMERALYAEDPKFASALRGSDPRTHHRRRVVKASIGFAAGIALLLTGVVLKQVPVSIIGFLLMLGAAFFAISSLRKLPQQPDLTVVGGATSTRPGGRRPRGAKKGRQPGRGGMMNRLEDRWNRRREGDES